MAIQAAKLMVEIGADISQLNSGLGQSQTALGKFAKSTMGAGSALTALITVPSLAAAGAVVNVGMAFEQTQVAFRKMLGSGEKAKKFLDELKSFAAATPFEFPELQEASKRMLAYGFAAEDILPMLRDIGDASAGLGAGTDGVNRITLALGQMQGKSKVSAQEMMQLTEVGIPAWKYLADSMGLSTQEVMKMSEQGLIPAGRAIEAILDGMRQNFGGMMEEQAKTAGGAWSNLKGDLYELAIDMGTVLMPTVKDLIGYARETVGWLKQLSPETQKNIIGFVGLAAAVGPALIGLGAVASSIQTLYTFGKGTVLVMQGLATAFKAWQAGMTLTTALGAAGIGPIAISLGAVALAAAAVVGVWVQWNQQITKTNQAGREAVSSTWTKFFDEQVSAGKGAAEVLAEYQAAQGRVNAELEKAGALKIFMGDTQQLKGDVEGLNQALAQTSSTYLEYVSTAQSSGEAINLMSEQQWEAARALGAIDQASVNAGTGLDQFVSGLEDNGEAFGQQIQHAQDLAGEIGILTEKYNGLQTDMENWTKSAAGEMASELERATGGTESYAKGLGAIDEVMGTDLTAEKARKDAIKQLTDEYARTGDLEAYKKGLMGIKDEGLANMVEEAEKARAKVEELRKEFEKLPKDVTTNIHINEMKTTTVKQYTESKTGTTAGQQNQALGGPVWANQPYIVGERSRELFTPRVDGRIDPNPGKAMTFRNYGTVIVGQDGGFGADLLAALN